MTFWQLVFIVKITTDSLSFQRILTSSICLQIQLRAVAEARLTPAGQRPAASCDIDMYTHILRNIKQAVKESCMLCPQEQDAPFPVLQQKVVFRVKVMVTPKTTNKPGPRNSRLPSRCWTDSNHTAASKRDGQLELEGSSISAVISPAFAVTALAVCQGLFSLSTATPSPSNTGPSTTTWQSETAMPCPFHSFFRNHGSLYYRKGLMLSCMPHRYSLQWRALFDTCRKLPFLHLIFHLWTDLFVL